MMGFSPYISIAKWTVRFYCKEICNLINSLGFELVFILIWIFGSPVDGSVEIVCVESGVTVCQLWRSEQVCTATVTPASAWF